MTRWLVIAALGLSAVGCSPDDDDHHHGKRPVALDCSQNLTCDTCTPVIGCGWCSFADGSGRCASGPGACGATFRWNWEPSDCPASPPAPDAGASDVVSETAPETAVDAESDAAEVAADAAVDAPVESSVECRAPSSFPAGCSRTTGGTLCGAGQYTVGCHDTGKPVGCTAALTSGGSTYYCCPCN